MRNGRLAIMDCKGISIGRIKKGDSVGGGVYYTRMIEIKTSEGDIFEICCHADTQEKRELFVKMIKHAEE